MPHSVGEPSDARSVILRSLRSQPFHRAVRQAPGARKLATSMGKTVGRGILIVSLRILAPSCVTFEIFMSSLSYKLPGPHVAYEQFDADLVILNLTTGQYFGCNAPAASVWGALMAGATLVQIAEDGPALASASQFVDKLLALGLLIPETARGVTVDPALRSALAADRSEPILTTYDDLSDLIIADPVHEVDDDKGWPNLPKSDQP